jgi:hypothetical protein
VCSIIGTTGQAYMLSWFISNIDDLFISFVFIRLDKVGLLISVILVIIFVNNKGEIGE